MSTESGMVFNKGKQGRREISACGRRIPGLLPKESMSSLSAVRQSTVSPVEDVGWGSAGNSGERERRNWQREDNCRSSLADAARDIRVCKDATLPSAPDPASVLSHELLSPLNRIKGYTATLLTLGDVIDEKHKTEYIKRIDAAAERLIQLLTGIQSLTCLTEVDDSASEFVSMASLVQKVVSEMQNQSTKHVIRLHNVGHLRPVKINRLQIEQVILNLITNAIKYSPQGGDIDINVRLASNEQVISAPAERVPPIRLPAVSISVADHGIGISETDLNRLFECFYRAKNPVTAATPGAGLGLYICRKIVHAHGGRIWASSTLGEGSTFTITLPVAGAAKKTDDNTEPCCSGWTNKSA